MTGLTQCLRLEYISYYENFISPEDRANIELSSYTINNLSIYITHDNMA